ncbi:MAG TPA: hypothetical protein VE360_01120 [Pyrinomonadaceae bacterium]|nr:hypothetical protein [Pyrinomonadaceae bacterium]
MRLIILVGVAACVALTSFAQDKFDYLKVEGQTVESTHKLRYVARIDKSFKPLGEHHHQPTYGAKMFNVSVAAYARGDDLVMIHAEAHTDGSGGLDYSNLKPDPLGGIGFTSREQCAVLAEIPDPYSIPDLRFLRDKGFTPAPAVFLKQYLIASPDGSAEYVYSYGRRVASCGDGVLTPAFKAGVERAARAVSINKL